MTFYEKNLHVFMHNLGNEEKDYKYYLSQRHENIYKLLVCSIIIVNRLELAVKMN